MEIWIVGGIIVALMIYASTKIKKLSAQAYEREIIETNEFSIIKPEGFLNPVESKFAFEAYTKDFGTDEAEEIRQAHVALTIKDTPDPGSEDLTETQISDEKGVSMKIFRRLVRRNHKIYELTAIVLEENLADLEGKINEMLKSFTVK